MDRLYALGGDDITDEPEYEAASSEAMALEGMIVATLAERKSDVAAKWRFIIKMNFLDEDSGYLGKLIEMILRRDAEAVGASLPFPEGCHGVYGVNAVRIAAKSGYGIIQEQGAVPAGLSSQRGQRV